MSLFHTAPDEDYADIAHAAIERVRFAPLPANYPPNLKQTLRWEKNSRLFYHAALAVRICEDAGLGTERMQTFRRDALAFIGNLDGWRPGTLEDFEANNWSNGYFPGAWGLLGGDPERFREQGASFIERLPGAGHWRRRSSNHGIVIYAAFLVGAAALGEEPTGLDVLREVIATMLSDGYYAEGVNYLSFVLSELLPLVRAYWNPAEDWREHVAAFLPGLPGAKEMFIAMAGLRRTTRGTFGDVGELRYYENILRFADSLGDNGDVQAALANQFQRPDPRLAPLARDLPEGGAPFDRADHIYPQHVAVAKTPDWALWINGSLCHRTHNASHDCGSYIFETRDLLVAPADGKYAYCHNVPLLNDAPDFPNCVGPAPFEKRKQHGTVEKIGEHGWRVVAPPAFQGCPSSIAVHLRHLHVVDGALLVIDWLRVRGDGEPVVQHYTAELHSAFGHSFHGLRSLCAMRPWKGGWVGASVIGGRSAPKLDDGRIVLNAKGFEIPRLDAPSPEGPTPPETLQEPAPRGAMDRIRTWLGSGR